MQPKSNWNKTPKSSLLVSLTCLSALSLALFNGCGIDENPHYPTKRFGQSTDTLADIEDTSDIGGSESSPEPANQTLLHQKFAGYFDLTSVRAVYYGEDPHNGHISGDNGLIDNAIGTALSFIIPSNATETLEMHVKQQSSTVKSVTQAVHTDGGDALSNFKGEDSQSGTQQLDWTTAQPASNQIDVTHCPKTFVCINRMIWKPKTGKTFTYCYRDHATKTPVSVPYSANSNFTKEAYEAAIGSGYTSKPIDVTSHPGEVSCDDPEKITYDVTPVTYKLSLGNLTSQADADFHRRAIHKPLKADTEVIIEYRLHDMRRGEPFIPKRGPYIDQRTRLNSKIKYFVNSSEHVITKLERTVMSPFKFGTTWTTQFLRDAYGEAVSGAFSSVMGPENDIEGLELKYSFEFCTHLSLIENPYNHCSGQVMP